MKNGILAALAIALLPLAAGADQAAADKCAASLLPPEKAVYDATKPKLKPGDDVREAANTQARQLVFDGTIGRAVARTSAGKAATCLALLRQ